MICGPCQERRRRMLDALFEARLADMAREVGQGLLELTGLKEKGDGEGTVLSEGQQPSGDLQEKDRGDI